MNIHVKPYSYQFSTTHEESLHMNNFTCRHWRSEHIRSYVMALSATHMLLLLILDREQPLHLVEEHSPAGVALWAWYNVVVGLPDCARTAVDLALVRWPEDAGLREMREQLRTVV